MILKILMVLASVFALYWAGKIKNRMVTFITMGMIAGIVLTLFSTKTIQTSGFYVYMGFVALSFVYGLTMKERKIVDKLIICLMSASIFAYWLWVLNHWHGNAVLFAIFTLIVGVVGVFSKVKLKNEFGFIIILGVDAIAIILENWMKAN